MPNKSAPNGFLCFVQDFKQKNPRKFESLEAAIKAASPHWNKMTPEQRKPFNDKAKAKKASAKVAKYTTTGVKIDEMQRRENEREVKRQAMIDHINRIIATAKESGHLADEVFYLIHVNDFGFCNSTKEHIPAELAVAKFSLRVGVTSDSVFHIIVKPGPMPLGYLAQAKKASNDTHQLEPPFGDEAEDNLTQVMQGLQRFITEINRNYEVPPVYTTDFNKDVAENVLKSLCRESGYDENLFKVYSVEHMFYELRNAAASETVYASTSISKLELEKDKYDFCKDIACSYHELSDVPNHCSRSHVIRLAYIICDNCCGDMNIQLIPGQHVPREANITGSRSHSRASGYASSIASASTVKRAPTRGNGFYDTQKENYYLSQRTESGMSTMSETSSVFDPNDYDALRYGYDSECSQVDAGEWEQPKQRHRRNDNKSVLSQSSISCAGGTSDLHFVSSNTPSESGSTQPVSRRRPNNFSAGLTGQMSQVSISSALSGSPKTVMPIGKGRGRGMATNFTKKAP